MHAHRTRLAVAVAALATAASLVTAAPAGAAPSSAPPASVSSPSAEPAAAARARGSQPRFISIRGIEPRTNRFFIKGRVRPSYENRQAVIQRRVGRTGRWNAWDTFRTNGQSRYRERVSALRRPGRVYYRVKVNGSGNYRKSFSGSVYIRTFRA
ncbi:hypothetical protein [Nocardioides sp. GXQ0305]|uniref:hypothetical protein n=1 Tax=Nocardioides sp. GXQ0305 TaxID=3423912 RepID=UPI003D7DD819